MGLFGLGFHPFIVLLLHGLCSERKWKGRWGSSNAAAENISVESCCVESHSPHTFICEPLKVSVKTKLHLLWQRSGMFRDKTSAPFLLERWVNLCTEPSKTHLSRNSSAHPGCWIQTPKGTTEQQFGTRLKKWVLKLSSNGAWRGQILKKKHASKCGKLLLLSRPDKKHLISCSHCHWIHASFAIKLYGPGVCHPAVLVLSRTISWAGKSQHHSLDFKQISSGLSTAEDHLFQPFQGNKKVV